MTKSPFGFVLAILLATFVPSAEPAHAEILMGVATVIDGDSIEIDGQRVRLLDIDAPESAQLCRDAGGAGYPCGQRSAEALSDFLQQRKVTCDWSHLNDDGWHLGRCVASGQDIGLWQIQQGWAIPARDCKCETYRAAAVEAKAKRLGLWAGLFETQ
jgi:endonuclease YncB( thermonuclease family)